MQAVAQRHDDPREASRQPRPASGRRGQVAFLETRLLDAAPAALPVLRDALKPYRSDLAPKLWSILDAAKAGDQPHPSGRRGLAGFRAGQPALATDRWRSFPGARARSIPVFLGQWLDALRPVRMKLTGHAHRSLPRQVAARGGTRDRDQHPGRLRRRRPAVLADLLMDADPESVPDALPESPSGLPKTPSLFSRPCWRRGCFRRERGRWSRQRPGTIWPSDRHGRRWRLCGWAKPSRSGPSCGTAPTRAYAASSSTGSTRWGSTRSWSSAGLERYRFHRPPAPLPGQQPMDAVLFHPEPRAAGPDPGAGTYGTDGLSAGERDSLAARLARRLPRRSRLRNTRRGRVDARQWAGRSRSGP